LICCIVDKNLTKYTEYVNRLIRRKRKHEALDILFSLKVNQSNGFRGED